MVITANAGIAGIAYCSLLVTAPCMCMGTCSYALTHPVARARSHEFPPYLSGVHSRGTGATNSSLSSEYARPIRLSRSGLVGQLT